MSFPNAVDAGDVTYSLYQAPSGSNYGFLIDPRGKVVVGRSLRSYYMRPGRPYRFDTDIAKHVSGATDPFGLNDVPPACARAYSALRLGQFELARAFAKRLVRVRNEKIKAAAEKMVAAADETEKKKLELMEALASDGRAGELEEEMRAFLLAFPRSKSRFKLHGLASAAKRTQKGGREALAASNFNRALGLLMKNNAGLRSQALTICRAITSQLKGTYHAGVAEALLANWPTGR